MHKQGIKFIDGKGLTRITKIFKNIINLIILFKLFLFNIL